MGQSLTSAAVCGESTEIVLSPEQRKLLVQGDIEGLLELHRSAFGSSVMKDDDMDEDDESKDVDGTEDGDEDDEDEGDEDEGDDEDEKSKPDPKDVRIREISAEAKKYRLRNRENRARIAELERQLAEKGKPKTKEKDDSDDESDTKVDDARVSQLERTNEDLLIRLEFMQNKKYSWKNPKAALRLLDLSDVEIDEDGDIEGLDEAIEALAKSDPYLLDTGEKDGKDTKRRGATGQPTGGTRKGNPSREKLLSKYPALRR